MEPITPETQASAAPATPAIPVQPTKPPELLSPKKSFNPWIITTVLLVVFVIASGIVLFYYHPWKTSDEKQDEENTEDYENSEGNENAGDETDDDDGDGDDDFDMAAEWSTYTSTDYNFSLKYPRDLTYTENGTLASGSFSAGFTGGGTISVFTAWMVSAESGTPEQTVGEQRIANQCTDHMTYSTYSANALTFTRVTEVPDQTCLATLGITRDIPLEAFVWKIDPTTFFVLVNEGLNAEQLEAVLGTITL